MPWLKDRVANDTYPAVRQAAVQELERGWKDDPNVRAFLAQLEPKEVEESAGLSESD